MTTATLLLAAAAFAAPRSAYQEGITAFETRDFAGAEADLTAVDVRQEPHAAYVLGVIAEQRRDFPAAVARFDAFLSAASPRHDLYGSGLAHRAYCLASSRRYADAAAASAAASLDTADRVGGFLLAYADLLVADQDKIPALRLPAARRAEARFTRLIATTESRNPDAHNGLGLARLSLHDSGAAAAEFESAIVLDPRPVFLNNLGAARIACKDATGARAAFERAASLATEGDPDHLRARRALAKLEVKGKK